MDTGKRDQRIRILEKSVTQDPVYGTEVIGWVTYAEVFAQIQDVLPSRAESSANGIRIENRPARVRTQYLPGVTSDMRVVLINRGDRLMKIVSGPAELGRKSGTEFMAEEYSSTGDAA